MATSSRIRIATSPTDGFFVNETVSFTSSAGDNASFRGPGTYPWLLQTLRAFNGEGAARDMRFLLTDSDGVEHAVLSMSDVSPVSVPSGDVLVWNGNVIVPPTWRIYAKWYSMAGGASCNWQYTAVELSP
ncbi:MAG: hypothetical protein D6683_17880 [Actinomyces sp.]|nr:MAG: hypothetical protein D6683_17880 [Actinomyces sp.]